MFNRTWLFYWYSLATTETVVLPMTCFVFLNTKHVFYSSNAENKILSIACQQSDGQYTCITIFKWERDRDEMITRSPSHDEHSLKAPYCWRESIG